MVDAIPLDDEKRKFLVEACVELQSIINKVLGTCSMTKFTENDMKKCLKKVYIFFVSFTDEIPKEAIALMVNGMVDIVVPMLLSTLSYAILDIRKDKFLYKNRGIFLKMNDDNNKETMKNLSSNPFFIVGNTITYNADEQNDDILEKHTNDPVLIEHVKHFNTQYKERVKCFQQDLMIKLGEIGQKFEETFGNDEDDPEEDE